jgi:hypothetical protein
VDILSGGGVETAISTASLSLKLIPLPSSRPSRSFGQRLASLKELQF